MSIFDRLLKRASPQSGFQSYLRSVFGISALDSSTAQRVTVRSSLTLSPIWSAIKIKGETVGGLHCSVYERKADGSIVEAIDHDTWPLLNYEPSPEHNAFTFKETLQNSIDLNGNGFFEIRRKAGRIKEFWYHPYETVELLYPERGVIKYRVAEPGMKSRILDFDAMVHIPAMASLDGIWGLSPIIENAKTLGLGQSARDFGSSFFANGGNVSGILTSPGNLADEQKTNIRKEWESNYRGIANVGKTAILFGGMTYTPISINPVDSGLIDSLKFSVEEASRIYRIPLHMMSSLERATNNNIEHQGIEFVVYCVLPTVKRWEYELNRKLFLTRENRGRYFVRFNIDSLLRGDAASRAEYYTKMFNIGVLSQNDIRRLENLNPIGPEGDKYYVQLNMGQPTNTLTNEPSK